MTDAIVDVVSGAAQRRRLAGASASARENASASAAKTVDAYAVV